MPISKSVLAALSILVLGASLASAGEPITDAAMCQARLETHKTMLVSSDAGEKTNNHVANLIEVFSHLCETEAYDEALKVGDTIRGMLASEN
jgi:hypothetical protein